MTEGTSIGGGAAPPNLITGGPGTPVPGSRFIKAVRQRRNYIHSVNIVSGESIHSKRIVGGEIML